MIIVHFIFLLNSISILWPYLIRAETCSSHFFQRHFSIICSAFIIELRTELNEIIELLEFFRNIIWLCNLMCCIIMFASLFKMLKIVDSERLFACYRIDTRYNIYYHIEKETLSLFDIIYYMAFEQWLFKSMEYTYLWVIQI